LNIYFLKVPNTGMELGLSIIFVNLFQLDPGTGPGEQKKCGSMWIKIRKTYNIKLKKVKNLCCESGHNFLLLG
jgi:hypothetical protein